MGADAEENQEIARATANPSLNSISEGQFAAWKRRKDADATARKETTERKRVEDIAAGVVRMNGRELFEREPWVFDNTQY